MKTVILYEMFGLPGDASLEQIINTSTRLSKLKVKLISEKRLESIKKKCEVIPNEYLLYYPEGDKNLSEVNEDQQPSLNDGGDAAAKLLMLLLLLLLQLLLLLLLLLLSC